MDIGIYAIRSKSTGKEYIGGSTQISKRLKRHIRDLKNNNHHSFLLQEWYNRLSISDLEFIILEECTESSVKLIEQNYIDKIDFSNTFNISKKSCFGDVISYHPKRKDIIKKIAKANKNRYLNMNSEERNIKYGRKLNLNGNWKGGITKSKEICSCGNPKNFSAEKCIKCYDKSGKKNPFYGKKHTESVKEKIRNSNLGRKPINCKKVLIDNVLYNSATHASKEIGCSVATIGNRVKNKDNYSWVLN